MTAITLRTLPRPQQALFTSFLLLIGIGYLIALSYLFLVDVEPHASKGMGLVAGIAEKYHGSPSRLEAALRGPMADRIGDIDKNRIFGWIRDGAKTEGYDAVRPIFEANCARCHSATSGVRRANGDPLPTFGSYEEISSLVDADTGPSVRELDRVSHVHLFGISIIFLLTGFIFSLSETPRWFRILLIVTPYVAIIADIGSWWATKWQALFAIVVVVGGGLMGLSLAGQILVSLWDMWLARRPLSTSS
jgi:hypothetical protein